VLAQEGRCTKTIKKCAMKSALRTHGEYKKYIKLFYFYNTEAIILGGSTELRRARAGYLKW
jgi:hypothetical protein